MKTFTGKIAVITGGGTGIGRELARQLAREGCHISICDISEEAQQQTRNLCLQQAPEGTRVCTFVADVAEEAQVAAFRADVEAQHQSACVHLVFNNAGIGGGGSFVQQERADWERTFAICWHGVYNCSRAFVPMLVASDGGHLINTSSVNGFWASLGPQTSHTAYSAAKFAVKGFTEALVNDFRNNAPHVKVSLVMPGHIGTSIITNSQRILGHDPKEMPEEELEPVREALAKMGLEVETTTPDQLRQLLIARAESFLSDAPMTAADAAAVILQGVREQRWRILVGEDAHVLDRMVRETPEQAYEPEFMEKLVQSTGWNLGT